jgi:hypothetical protein
VKLIITHLLLNLYLLAIIQPAIPVIEYFINYNYIATQLCENRDKPLLECNGKCYLEKQVSKQQNSESNSSVPMPPKIDLEKFISLKIVDFTYQISKPIQATVIPLFCNSLKEATFNFFLFRPPSCTI